MFRKTLGSRTWLIAVLMFATTYPVIASADREGPVSQGSRIATPPNIVLILTDDQRADTLRFMPNVQRLLVGNGIAFTNGYVVNPVCCPSRASSLTGDMVVVGSVGAVASFYAIGYARGPVASRTAWTALPLFVLGMQLVPATSDAFSFLLMWEVMAVTSTFLVLTDHARNPDVRTATLWYAVMTQLSFLLLLIGFALLATEANGTSFAAMSTVDPSSGRASVGFVLLVVGFATKAGIVPLHIWLPRAHPVAPSHVSAVMSAAMVKMGVYGAVLLAWQLLPDGPAWWGLLVLGLGAVSAVYGILQASVATDLKRLLAYSTTENVGLMFVALGVAILPHGAFDAGLADVAVAACLLLVVGHATFKTALFLGAGSVLHATGERDLDRMGGLMHRMPATAITFGIGALGAAALPVTVGFASEWVLLQALIHGGQAQDRLVAVVLPVAIALVALTAGLALLTFVKAFGLAFLARARSAGTEAAVESGATMRIAMLAAAAMVVALGLVPGAVVSVSATAADLTGVEAVGLVGIDLAAVGALLDPAALALMAAAMSVPIVLVSMVASRRRARRRVDLAWGCGGMRVSPRMQYTATSYAEPLARVFDDALRPERDVDVTHLSESRYLVERVQFRQQVSDVVEDRVYQPLVSVADRVGVFARQIQNGSIHRYLGYAFAALLIVLLVVSL